MKNFHNTENSYLYVSKIISNIKTIYFNIYTICIRCGSSLNLPLYENVYFKDASGNNIFMDDHVLSCEQKNFSFSLEAMYSAMFQHSVRYCICGLLHDTPFEKDKLLLDSLNDAFYIPKLINKKIRYLELI